MFIKDEGFAVPELLDAILLNLLENDLYRCLLVNRQFYRHAFPILYQTAVVHLQPNYIFYRPFRQRAHREIVRQYKAYIDFARHIIELQVILNDALGTNDFRTVFPPSIFTVIEKSSRVKKVILNDAREDKNDH